MFYPITVGDRLMIAGRYNNPWEVEITDLGYDYLEFVGSNNGRTYKHTATTWNSYTVCEVLESSLTYRLDKWDYSEYWTHTDGAVISRHTRDTRLAGYRWRYNGRRITRKWLMQALGELQ